MIASLARSAMRRACHHTLIFHRVVRNTDPMSPSKRTVASDSDSHFLQPDAAASPAALATLLRSVAGSLQLASEHRRTEVTLLDTIDWRLLREDFVLEHERAGGEATLGLRPQGRSAVRLAAAHREPPGSAAGVRGAFLGRRLQALTAGRALLPVAMLRREETLHVLRDAEGKQRLGLALRTARVD